MQKATEFVTKLRLLSGTPIPVPELGTALRQPTIKEIAALGEDEFFQAINLMGFTKETFINAAVRNGKITKEQAESVKNELMFTTDFQLLLNTVNSEEKFKQILTGFLLLILEGARKVSLDDSFAIISWSDNRAETIMDDAQFQVVASLIPLIFSTEQLQKEEFNPLGEKAAAIAEKIKRRREKVAHEQGKAQDSNSALGTAASILSTANSIPLTEVLEYTVPQLFMQLERIGLYKDYETQITLGAFGGLKDVDIANWKEPI